MPTNRRILRSSSYRAQVFIAGLLVACIAVCGSTSANPSASQVSQADSQLAALNRSTNADQNPGSSVRKQLTPGHEKMLTILNEIAVRTPETNDYLGGRLVNRLRGVLLNLPTKAPDLIRWRLHMEIAEGELRLGNETEAIAEFTQARQLISQLTRHTLCPGGKSHAISPRRCVHAAGRNAELLPAPHPRKLHSAAAGKCDSYAEGEFADRNQVFHRGAAQYSRSDAASSRGEMAA